MEGDSTNWREVLRQQQEDLKALQQQATKVDDDDLDADIERVLRRPIAPSWSSTKASKVQQSGTGLGSGAGDDYLNAGDEPDLGADEEFKSDAFNAGHGRASSGGSQGRGGNNVTTTPPRPTSGTSSSGSHKKRQQSQPQQQQRTHDDHDNTNSGGDGEHDPLDDADEAFGDVAGGDSVATPKAPEAGARFHKAKLKVLTKQLNEANEMRRRFSDQVDSLTHQLRNDREENKALKKRIQLLEVENKKFSGRRVAEAAVGDKSEALQSEVNQLKKDIQSAERIVKQAENEAKTKDTQLKRALETITRLKAQLAEQQQAGAGDGGASGSAAGGGSASGSELAAATSRVQVLEKQRNDLIVAFRKQMKLIDLLKRQKMHVEASRLLSFTEEEFMKTLDWAV